MIGGLRLVLLVAAILLVACGTPAPAGREVELGATIAALEATIAAGSPDASRKPALQASESPPAGTISEPAPIQPTDVPRAGDEPPPDATVVAEAAAENPAAGPGAITAVMEELMLAGEPFATEGDSNAPLTIIEFSDYG